MSVEFNEQIFDDNIYFGDNGNRVEYLKAKYSAGTTQILRYKAPDNKHATLKTFIIFGGLEYQFLNGAYLQQQEGAVILIRFGGTTKFEHRLQWTSAQGYVGGADDYGDEGRVHLPMQGQEVDASTAIVVRVTASSARRRVWFADLIGELDDGTTVRESIRQIADGTAAADISLYTVPAGRHLHIECIDIAMRVIDGILGKAYMLYNGVAFLGFDLQQGDIDSYLGLVFPIMDADIEGGVIGVRFDSFECGDEWVNATAFIDEEWKVAHPIFGGVVISARGEEA